MDSKGKAHGFSNVQWLLKLAFLVDMSEILNYLNASLQIKGELIHNLFGEIKAFEANQKLWQGQLRKTCFIIVHICKVHLGMVKVIVVQNMLMEL